MSSTSRSGRTVNRVDVASANGTVLCVWVEGDGPPIVLVHGSLADHTTFQPLVAELCKGAETFSMDRRGYGASGDGPTYSIEREFEDVAAVCDSVAARAGGPVALWGHSYGAGCAMGGAALTENVSHLVLYEPGLGIAYPDGSIAAIEEELASGNREQALLAVLVGVLDLTDAEVASLRSSARWANLLDGARHVPREASVEDGWTYRPGQFDSISVPTLFLAGSASPPALSEATRRASAAIRGADIRELEGHAHLAHSTDPAMIAAIIREFISS